MKASKFTEAQIAIVLKQAEDSVAVAKVSRQLYGRQHSFVPTSSTRCGLSKMDCTSPDFTDADLRGVRTAKSVSEPGSIVCLNALTSTPHRIRAHRRFGQIA